MVHLRCTIESREKWFSSKWSEMFWSGAFWTHKIMDHVTKNHMSVLSSCATKTKWFQLTRTIELHASMHQFPRAYHLWRKSCSLIWLAINIIVAIIAFINLSRLNIVINISLLLSVVMMPIDIKIVKRSPKITSQIFQRSFSLRSPSMDLFANVILNYMNVYKNESY